MENANAFKKYNSSIDSLDKKSVYLNNSKIVNNEARNIHEIFSLCFPPLLNHYYKEKQLAVVYHDLQIPSEECLNKYNDELKIKETIDVRFDTYISNAYAMYLYVFSNETCISILSSCFDTSAIHGSVLQSISINIDASLKILIGHAILEFCFKYLFNRAENIFNDFVCAYRNLWVGVSKVDALDYSSINFYLYQTTKVRMIEIRISQLENKTMSLHYDLYLEVNNEAVISLFVFFFECFIGILDFVPAHQNAGIISIIWNRCTATKECLKALLTLDKAAESEVGELIDREIKNICDFCEEIIKRKAKNNKGSTDRLKTVLTTLSTFVWTNIALKWDLYTIYLYMPYKYTYFQRIVYRTLTPKSKIYISYVESNIYVNNTTPCLKVSDCNKFLVRYLISFSRSSIKIRNIFSKNNRIIGHKDKYFTELFADIWI
ncbi:hypothetical protein PHYBLDRAFT_163698 [Phycomyces blakesleeanus NRRL 1555(-)]|uniref:Uncharacterized protein n=1 Tax=Phycomyces blakesleeanus (strain ATCC 8743b / DSM 1359 / FGSC 10004 / NBRC 33097 / NRRL 1555) TaxID=763407 RepID=A0A167PVA2_PHYB8|nr:hypothetical protein PHYBLDRAFT_163698 [Phycomyces blakesleeanus NRRL 1555(-)]OAD78597.1 hypothetical protein PHYBLDRAFT_163698 [Phycomyces blakesleeanus NRRL 1555(-)]|eukprot:XP_018296637.1 hypothetical protein PHYBLDRAFT_163698 [Phycomyces blakesleeanus NRRL 1555(-)]